jgi:hypothetical protein
MPPRPIPDLRTALVVAQVEFRPDQGAHWVSKRAFELAADFEDDGCFEAARRIDGGADWEASPEERREGLEAGVRAFLAALRSALDRLEKRAPLVDSNASLDDETCRQLVLGELYTAHPQTRSIGALEDTLALSFRQVTDALDDLGAESALDKYTSYVMGGLYSRRLALNANGRRLARGLVTLPKQSRRPAQQIVHQHNEFHHSQIGVAGVAHAPVMQKMTAKADIAEMITALAALRELAEATNAQSIVSAANEVTAELTQHGWTSKATTFLMGLGMFVQTLGEAKPAYTLVQSIASTHGITLPDMP